MSKLEWYRMGGEVSDLQWKDVIGVLKVQRTSLNHRYLTRWAEKLDIADLLDRALLEAG